MCAFDVPAVYPLQYFKQLLSVHLQTLNFTIFHCCYCFISSLHLSTTKRDRFFLQPQGLKNPVY